MHVGVFYDDATAARNAPKGSIELAFCHRCGHVFNRRFDPEQVRYQPGYEVALHYSPTFRSFMESVANRLIEKFDLHGKSILEIGAGGAWFLELVCRLGSNHGVGVDPTIAQPGRYKRDGYSIELIREIFDDRFAAKFQGISPDFVCCLSVLEHIASPGILVAALRNMIADRNTSIYFEIFNASRAFQQQEIWSIHYEQCSYFSEQSFASLFARNGYRILECGSCYEGGQYLFVDALANGQISVQDPSSSWFSLPPEIEAFATRFQERLSYWTAKLVEWRRVGKRVAFWGTGGKGVTFLNLLATRDSIEYVAEINPTKQHKFVPGCAQKIVPPEFLSSYQPDVVILSNALYEQEIREQSRQLGLRSEFYVA